VKGKIASDRSRSDGMEPLSGRVVSEMQAVSSPVPEKNMSSSSPDVIVWSLLRHTKQ